MRTFFKPTVLNNKCTPEKKHLSQEPGERENVGLVRFELTIDGSLRHASVLQRIIIKHRIPDEDIDALPNLTVRQINSADPLFIICEHKERKDRWSPSPFRARPQPPGHAREHTCVQALTVQNRAKLI